LDWKVVILVAVLFFHDSGVRFVEMNENRALLFLPLLLTNPGEVLGGVEHGKVTQGHWIRSGARKWGLLKRVECFDGASMFPESR